MNSNITATPAAMVVRSGEGQTFRWGRRAPSPSSRGRARLTGRSASLSEPSRPVAARRYTCTIAEAEAFYILDGAVQLTCGDQTVTAHAGDFVYTPKDVAHKFVVAGDKPARMLMLFSCPGFERFFAEGGSPVDQPPAGPPSPDAFRQLVEKYNMELLEMPAH
jgi:Cupin domain